MILDSPVHSVSGRRPSHPVSAASTAGCTSPYALCWVRPSCSTSTLHRTLSTHFWKHIHRHYIQIAHSLGSGLQPASCSRRVNGVLAAVTHGGGLSGRPSDLSFRCLSAFVRVDLTISSWVMFNSGCCWMYSRITPWNITNTEKIDETVRHYCSSSFYHNSPCISTTQ